MTDETPRDVFDKVIGLIDGTPGTRKTRPTTLVSVEALLGDAQTYVVQTYKTEDGFYSFVQMIDRRSGARFVLPPKVMNAIYRQMDALVKASRSARAKDRWNDLSEEERKAKVSHLRRKSA
jgi:hypothetical protein